MTPYGLIFLAAIGTAWFFARRNAKSVSIDPSHIDLLIPLTISAGIVGGTLIALLLSGDEGIRVKLFAVVGIGAAALFAYGHFARLPFGRLLDVFALPVVAALMVHRVGCFLAGCCWGDVVSNDVVRGVQYPPGSFAYEQHVEAGLILTVCSYVLIRFFLEYLRADSEVVLGNLTVMQLQCIVLISILGWYINSTGRNLLSAGG